MQFRSGSKKKPAHIPKKLKGIGVTPPKTNMEPENGGPLEKEIPIGNHHFQFPAINFRGCIILGGGL